MFWRVSHGDNTTSFVYPRIGIIYIGSTILLIGVNLALETVVLVQNGNRELSGTSSFARIPFLTRGANFTRGME